MQQLRKDKKLTITLFYLDYYMWQPDRRTFFHVLHHVQPCAKRKSHPVWSIAVTCAMAQLMPDKGP